MWQPLEIEIVRNPPVSVMRLKSDFTAESGDAFNEAFHALSEEGNKLFIVDFAEITHLNSGGLAVLIGMLSELKETGGKLAFSSMASHFKRMTHIIGLTDYITVHHSEEEAIEALTT